MILQAFVLTLKGLATGVPRQGARTDAVHDGKEQGAGDRLILRGLGVSLGWAQGPARIVRTLDDLGRVRPGDIAVIPCATLVRVVAGLGVVGIVCEVGGPLSKPARLARHLGLPAVFGLREATTRLTDGRLMALDGDAGVVAGAPPAGPAQMPPRSPPWRTASVEPRRQGA